MGWIKNIFSKESNKKVDNEEIQVEKPEEIPVSENICDACKLPIFGEQKSVSKGGKRYHIKPCWRNLQKIAKKEAFG